MWITRITNILLIFLIFSPATANEDRPAEIRDMLAEALYEEHPEKRLDELMEGGLDRVDSEEILIQLDKALATCMLDAIREYSSEMSLEFDEQLDLLEADLKKGEGGSYFSTLDQGKLERMLYPCSVAALQAAGLKVPNSAD
ncbi:MAG: hypothetical protein WBM34_09665 [Woeseiaceae bacterium]